MPFSKKVMLPFFWVVLSLVLTIDSYAQGPWSASKGSGFFQVQAIPSTATYNQVFLGSRDEFQLINRETWNADYGIYGQYSLTDRIQVIGYVPFKHVSTGAQTDSLYFNDLLSEGSLVGLGNVRLAFKYGILTEGFNVAVSLQSSWNTVSMDLEKGLSTGIQGNSIGIFAHLGGGITAKSYAFADIGFQKYTNNFSDVIEGRLEYGYRVLSPLYVILGLDIRQSLENGSYFNENLAQTGLYPNNQEWVVFNLKLNYETKSGIGFNVGFPLAPLMLNNIGATGSVSMGIYKKWNK
jgi:hypothetical protein